MKLRFHGIFLFFGEGRVLLPFLWPLAFTPPEPYPGLHLFPAAGGLAVPRFQTSPSSKAPLWEESRVWPDRQGDALALGVYF